VWSRDREGGREGGRERASKRARKQANNNNKNNKRSSSRLGGRVLEQQQERRKHGGAMQAERQQKKWPGKGKQSKQQKREAQPREGRGTKGVSQKLRDLCSSSGLLQGRSTMTHFFTLSLPLLFPSHFLPLSIINETHNGPNSLYPRNSYHFHTLSHLYLPPPPQPSSLCAGSPKATHPG